MKGRSALAEAPSNCAGTFLAPAQIDWMTGGREMVACDTKATFGTTAFGMPGGLPCTPSQSVRSGELNPDRGMVAGTLGTAHRAIDPGVGQAFGRETVEQHMVDPQTGVAGPLLTEIRTRRSRAADCAGNARAGRRSSPGPAGA